MASNATRPKIVVFGSINMDLVGTVDRMPVIGETIFGNTFFTAAGGKGANQAVAAARLGADVKMIGRVGKDAFGPVLMSGLRRHGIDVSSVYEDLDSSSGIAIITIDSSGQNHIVVISGANNACDDDQVAAAKSAIDTADTLMLQLEIPLDLMLVAARYANEKGVRVVWDPAPASDLPDEVYTLSDVITPNQIEVEELTGVAVTDEDSAASAASVLLERGVGATVVKLGEHGLYYATGDEGGYVPAFDVDAIDTVAAGDAFAGGIAVALSEGMSIEDAVRFASAAGALAVTKSGAQDAMPTRLEVEHLITNRL